MGPLEIQRYILRRQDAGGANATINRELAALRRGYTLAHQGGLVPIMPAIKPLRERNVRTGFFEESDFLAMRRHLPSEIQAVVTFAYVTGWRIKSEVLPLEWRQVDFHAALVVLDPGTTKNDAGRTFPLIPVLRTLLERELERTRALERARRQIIPWVFHRAGRPMRDFQRAWDTAGRKAGLAGRIPHDLRRTAVRNLIRTGVPERVAVTLTGHKTRSVFDRYNIVSEGDLRDAGSRLAGGIRHNLDTIEKVERDPRELSR